MGKMTNKADMLFRINAMEKCLPVVRAQIGAEGRGKMPKGPWSETRRRSVNEQSRNVA